ncbi:MAG: zf-HC2 domain-containing protein [Acidobacteriia bacterium]|nr:zf-HC2 domain-containing protein [Terriglobia bacterium]
MPGESKNGMQCAEFDLLLSEVLDETLSGDKLEKFQAHGRVCPVCGPLLAEAKEGRHWLKSLQEVEPPANLVHNILVATTGVDTVRLRQPASAQPQISRAERMREWAGTLVSPVWAVARQPRFAMSFGMAFFSLSLALSMAGVKLSDVQHVDLRPSAVKRTYYETSGRVVKYYENIRFVYEIESRVREFKRATTPAEPGPAPEERKERKNNNNTSGQPEQKQERNYSQGGTQPVLASAPNDPPVVTVTTYRRFV